MSWATGLAVYFVIWWLTLFMVLPWGVKRADPEDLLPGEDPGSPKKPRMLIKLLANSVLAGVFFAVFYFLHESGMVNFRQ